MRIAVNWKCKTLTIFDHQRNRTEWNFKLDEWMNLVLYSNDGRSWSPDTDLIIFKELEQNIKTMYNNEVNKILLEE